MAVQFEVKNGYLLINDDASVTNKRVRIPLVPTPSYCSVDGRIAQDGSKILPPDNAPKISTIASNGLVFNVEISVEDLDKIFLLENK